MNVLLTSFGSAGDIYPFVGLGIALRERGARVTMLVNEYFKKIVTDHGLDFAAVGSVEDYEQSLIDSRQFLQNPIRKARACIKAVSRLIGETMRTQYHHVAERFEPGRTVVVAGGLSFGAQIAHEKLGVAFAIVVLQPAALRSAYAMPKLAGVPRLPAWVSPSLKRGVIRIADRFFDRAFGASEVNAFRESLGLRSLRRLINEWWLSPQRVIALFPEWYAAPQVDWPHNLQMTGFPLFDGNRPGATLPGEVASFLKQGDPPVVFTPGSAMTHAHAFFREGVQACQMLGRRAILLTEHRDQLPKSLPDSVRHFSYVSLSQLLPKSAALVFHGGIGTLSQAMAAGVPQLVMPVFYDQPDNAMRLKQLGIGDWLKPKAFRRDAVARKLERLTHSPEVTAMCKEVARRLDGRETLRHACALIEDLVERRDTESSSGAHVGVQPATTGL